MDTQTRKLGAYDILTSLGEGGMGVVYLAEDRETGVKVALKTLTAPDANQVHGMRQEIRALRRLRHPNVVRVLDEGVEAGLPWYAMEVVSGKSLAEHLSREELDGSVGTRILTQFETLDQSEAELSVAVTMANAPPMRTLLLAEQSGHRDRLRRPASPSEDLDEVVLARLGWVGQVCRALAYMHGEGVVHCDLKPENILITDEGRAVVVDFGLAAQFETRLDADALERAGILSGTALYLCPERIQGAQFDARADLYAIGCILYEILTGRVPFEGNTVTHTFMQHLSRAPEPLSKTAPTVPPRLAALVMALLAKSPQERPGHANIVVEVIEDLGIDLGDHAEHPLARPYLYRPAVQGRDGLLDELKKHLSASVKGSGRSVLLGGDSGVGKTSLAVEVVRQARGRHMNVLAGQCLAGEGHDALEVLMGPLRKIGDACQERGPESSWWIFGDKLPLLVPYAPFLRDLPGVGAIEAAEELPPKAARLRLFRAIVQILEAYTKERPLLLVLDDLQWADALSLECLKHLCGPQLSDRRWFVLGLYRQEGADALSELLSMGGLVDLYVESLDRGAVGAMMAQMLALDRVPEQVVTLVNERARGNPFFVAEYLHLAVERGLLVLTPSGHWRWDATRMPAQPDAVSLSLTASLQAIVAGRVQALGGDARRVCEAAAVVGRDTTPERLREIAGLGEADFYEALMALERQRIIEDASATALGLAHDKVREITYEAIGEDERAELHRRAAEVLEAADKRGEPLERGRLGWHRVQAGQLQKARVAYLGAASDAVSQLAFDEAERHYRRALGLFEQEAGRGLLGMMKIAVRIKLVEHVLMILDRHEEAEAEILLAEEEARAISAFRELAQALCLLGEVRVRRGRIKEAIEPLEEALSLFEQLKDPRNRGDTIKNLANVYHQQGLYNEAMEAYEKALVLQRKAGDRGREAKVLHNMAMTAFSQGIYDKANEHYLAALSLFREVGDKRGESLTLSNLAVMCRRMHRFEASLDYHQKSLILHREIGNRLNEAMALNNIAVLYKDLGRLDEAMNLYLQALEIRREIGDRRREVLTLNNIANIHRDQRNLDAAMRMYVQALSVARHSGERRSEGQVLDSISTLHRLDGDYKEALRASRQALNIWRALDRPGGMAFSLLDIGRVQTLEGSLDEAEVPLSEGLAVAQAHGMHRTEAYAHIYLAMLRRHQGEVRGAFEALAKARTLFATQDDRSGQGLALCEQGHLAMGLGQDPRTYLGQARALLKTLTGYEEGVLREAVEAFEARMTALGIETEEDP